MSNRVYRGITTRRSEQGFTLIEAMIVVAIVGLLAALAVYGVKSYIRRSKTSEAMEMINSIKAAQESYRVDTFSYLDVSGAHALADLSTFHPTSTPANRKYRWQGYNTPVAAKWRSLNIDPEGTFYFTYGCAAGGPTDAVAPATTTAGSTAPVVITNWPTTWTDSWYVVKAIGDLDGDGKMQQWTSANFTERVYEPARDFD